VGGQARAEIKTATSSFPVGGKPVRVEHCAPDRPGKRPAVLLLHGSAGLPKKDADGYRSIARLLAQQGYVALLVHYFDSTDTEWIDPRDIATSARSWSSRRW
jgi:dienelactone hydrolase